MRRAVMDGVVGDHGLHTVEARPRVAVGKQEIFGTGGNGDPQAAALLEAFGEFCGADMDGDIRRPAADNGEPQSLPGIWRTARRPPA